MMNCQHQWVSAVNQHVTSGEMCTRCQSIRCDDGQIIHAVLGTTFDQTPYPGPRDHANGLIPSQPSMYASKSRHRDNPDLIEQFQLLSIALMHLMEDRGISQFVVPAERASELRMSRVEVTPDESDRLFVKLES